MSMTCIYVYTLHGMQFNELESFCDLTGDWVVVDGGGWCSMLIKDNPIHSQSTKTSSL